MTQGKRASGRLGAKAASANRCVWKPASSQSPWKNPTNAHGTLNCAFGGKGRFSSTTVPLNSSSRFA
jgi:hypothetical protein